MNYSVEPPIWLIGNRRYVVLDPSTQTAAPPPTKKHGVSYCTQKVINFMISFQNYLLYTLKEPGMTFFFYKISV